MKKAKRVFAIAVLAIAVILILVWQIAIEKCEYLTYKYGDAFERAYVGHTMFRDPDSFKVIEYTDTTAKVYYRSRGLGGDVVYYRRDDPTGEWTFESWETVWSDSGNADSFIWPHIR